MQNKIINVRTTIEITDRQRSKLLQLAAERGLKGFSELVQEAIDAYLDETTARKERVARAIAALGTLTDEDASELERSVTQVRSTWRAHNP